MNQYCALMADIKGSRTYSDVEREALQLLIVEALAYLNAFFEKGIEKKVVFSGGDEVQGLFRDPLTAFLYYRMLGFLLGFDVLRGGLGVGSWSVRVDASGSASQDGPVYHNARAAIIEAKKSRRFDVVLRSQNSFDDMLITLMDHSLSICKMRTVVQSETALAVELLRPLVPFAHNLGSQVLEERLALLGLAVLKDGRDNRGLIARVLECGSARTLLLSGERTAIGQACPGRTEFELLGGDIAGVAYRLAQISCTARQGIDRQVSQGRVVQERNAVALLAFSLGQLFGW